jgi:hypothetical protein
MKNVPINFEAGTGNKTVLFISKIEITTSNRLVQIQLTSPGVGDVDTTNLHLF